MKAVVIHAYGGVDQLMYEDMPVPQAGPGEVLIRMISTSVNPVDYKIRNGSMKDRMPIPFPYILGRDVAGEIIALGPDVSKFCVGDHVIGLVNHSYAEFLTATADGLAKIPVGLDAQNAGVLPLVGLTGAQLIETGVKPASGETILITGALGSVGRTAVMVSKQHGCKVIAGVRAKQKEEAQSLGADGVVALDDPSEIDALPELNAIADTVGGKSVVALFPKLKKPGGRLASVLGKPEGADQAGIDVREVWAHPDSERLHLLAHDFRDGRLHIPIAKRMVLSQIRQAHQAAEQGSAGKIALTP